MRALVGATARVRSSARLEELSLAVFDRTFKVTEVLRVLAGIVAFLGILSALLAIELERARELSVLRTLGFTPGGLGATLLTQTGLLGLAAGLAAMPIGTALALLLVHVINRRSFGWTMDFVLTPQALVSGVSLAVIAALLAGIYPAWRAEPNRARRGAAGGLMRRLCSAIVRARAARGLQRRRARNARSRRSDTGLRLLGGEGGDGFARATEPREFVFPADHGSHPEYRTEWWYFTGNLATTSGRHFGFELTFFRYALAPARRGARRRVGLASRANLDGALRDHGYRRRTVHRARAADARGARARRRRRPSRCAFGSRIGRRAGEGVGDELALRLDARDDAIALALDLTSTVPPRRARRSRARRQGRRRPAMPRTTTRSRGSPRTARSRSKAKRSRSTGSRGSIANGARARSIPAP